MTTVDCQWMNARFEAYCCDQLPADEQRQAELHLERCEACQEELHALDAIDPLVRRLFQSRLAEARSPRASAPRRKYVPILAGTALAGAVLVLALFLRPVTAPLDAPSASLEPQPRTAAEQVVPKDAGPAGIDRAKPDAPDSTAQPSLVPAPAPGVNAEPFAVIDPAGYVRRLEDYRGYVLVFGLWSADQPRAARNLEQVYRTFAGNTKFRLLGVSNGKQTALEGVTFPIVYNHESRLLGAGESEFVLIDANGEERLRGSLISDLSGLLQAVSALAR